MNIRIAKGERVGGYPVLAWIPIDERERVILCDRGPEFHDPYVTAKYIPGHSDWMSGNYFADKDRAIADLAKRAGFPLAAQTAAGSASA